MKEKYYLGAINELCKYLYSIAEDSLDYEKLDAYVDRLSKTLFKQADKAKKDAKVSENCKSREVAEVDTVAQNKRIKKRGIVKFGISTIPQNIYVINDDYFAGAEYLLQWIVIKAIENGIDIEVDFCKFFQENVIENIAIPQLDVVFISNNFLSQVVTSNETKKINFSRFYNNLNKKVNKLSYTKNIILELMTQF
ncbi:hypothetical protein FACS1894132_02020 [Clostridia bacterium]|nr:hypothetical protein FACS1894132_02020 [Clostridia bacterium]